jgi:hypothetical protein
MDAGKRTRVRALGIAFIAFAIAFNLPYAWLGSNFGYPAILRSPPGVILTAFTAGGAAIVLAWAAFALAALMFAPVAIGVAFVTRRAGGMSSAVAALGVAAGVTQAIGLSRWVYAVPGLAANWTAAASDPGLRKSIETMFMMLHQFAGVGIGEAIGQSLTGLWLIGVAIGQWDHPRFGRAAAAIGMTGGVVLVFGLVEGLSTVLSFSPGVFGLAALIGYLVLTVWLILTGILCIMRPNAEA